FVSLCERLKSATDLPVWIKSNAGLPEVADGKIFYRMQPDQFTRYAGLIKEKGASFIGGCCGTTPEFVRALAASLNR
ncbi:MAG: homocysteine S-methyltransferase family protein, partial [Calditrichia bacterium]